MNTKNQPLDEAVATLAAGHEARALELLRDLLEATDDAEVIDEIRRLAVQTHDASTGFHAIEWKRLAIDAESREMTTAR